MLPKRLSTPPVRHLKLVDVSVHQAYCPLSELTYVSTCIAGNKALELILRNPTIPSSRAVDEDCQPDRVYSDHRESFHPCNISGMRMLSSGDLSDLRYAFNYFNFFIRPNG